MFSEEKDPREGKWGRGWASRLINPPGNSPVWRKRMERREDEEL